MSVFGSGGVREFALHNTAKKKVAISYVKVTGQPFTEALRAEIKEVSSNPWDVQVQTQTTAPIAKGDVLLATFHVRTEWAPVESGEGQTEFVFELAREPWNKSVSYPIRAGSEWKVVNVPFVAEASYGPGEAQLIFRLGYAPQTLEVAGVSVQNFGKEVALSALPVTRISYPGREADAPWRKAAAERIEKHRKAELTLVVKDKAGKVVPGAEVSANLVEHAFGFGTCAPAELLVGSSAARFKELVPELFNVVTLENDLKWQPLAGDWGDQYKLERAKAALEWLRARGLSARGHVLVWPGWRNLPKTLRELEKQPEKLRAEIRRHVRELATATRGSVSHWDVVNEPFDNHDLLDILGNEVMVEWFKDARAADPSAKLFINDYAILSGGGGTTPHRDHYERTIELLLAKGAPLDGIGLQGHFGSSLTAPEDMLKILDRYARFGKTLWVTEYDIVIDDLELAGSFTRDFFTTLFSHPAVGGIVMWGFWDGSHWKNNAPLYASDWSLKPAGKAYRELVLGEWRTRASGKTDARGSLSTRAFLGEYEVGASAGGRRVTKRAVLAAKGAVVELILE